MARLLLRRCSFASDSTSRAVDKAPKNLMKAITTKELVSLVVIAITAPVLALGVVLAASVIVVGGNELLLMTLTLCGAVVSGINGFGRRTVRAESQSRSSRGGHSQAWPFHHERC